MQVGALATRVWDLAQSTEFNYYVSGPIRVEAALDRTPG